MKKLFSLFLVILLTASFLTPLDSVMAQGENLLENGGMEANGSGEFFGWTGYASSWEGVSTWDQTVHRSGNASIAIEGDKSTKPFVTSNRISISAGAEYLVSIWAKMDPAYWTNARLLMYWTNEDRTIKKQERLAGDLSTWDANGWLQIQWKLRAPRGVEYVQLQPRAENDCKIWFDDASLTLLQEAPQFYIDTNAVFYYSDDEGVGTGTIQINDTAYPSLSGLSTVQIALKKEGSSTALATQNVSLTNGKGEFTFDTALLTEKTTPYSIEPISYSGEAQIYKFDRPLCLDKDGIYHDTNGQLVSPLIVYRYNPSYIENGLQGGINVAQASLRNVSLVDGVPKTYTKEEQLSYLKRTYLECAETKASDTKWMIALYYNSKPAGADENIETTRYLVEQLKDHPAVYAWMIMDEPFDKIACPEDDLRASYLAIREKDPNHPIYLCESTEKVDAAGKYTDILSVDPYPAERQAPSPFPGDRVALATEKGGKPVHSTLQAFLYGGYDPTGDDMRNMIYQSYMAGAKSIGYYLYRDADRNDLLLHENENLWPTMTEFAEKEKDDMFKVFVTKEYPTFCTIKNDRYWLTAYVKEAKLYVLVLNRTSASIRETVSLQSDDNTVALTNFTVGELVGSGYTEKQGNNLYFSLAKYKAGRFEIIPNDANALAGFTENTLPITVGETASAFAATLGISTEEAMAAFGGSSIAMRMQHISSAQLMQGLYNAMEKSPALKLSTNAGQYIEYAKCSVAALWKSMETDSPSQSTVKALQNVLTTWITTPGTAMGETLPAFLMELSSTEREAVWEGLQNGEQNGTVWKGQEKENLIVMYNVGSEPVNTSLSGYNLYYLYMKTGTENETLENGSLYVTLQPQQILIVKVGGITGIYNQDGTPCVSYSSEPKHIIAPVGSKVFVATYQEESGIKKMVDFTVKENGDMMTLFSGKGKYIAAAYTLSDTLLPLDKCYKLHYDCNLAQGGDFSQGLSGWSVSGTCNTVMQNGSIAAETLGHASSLQRRFDGFSGDRTYTLSVEAERLDGSRAQIIIYCYNTNGTNVGSIKKDNTPTFSFTTPTDTAYIQVLIRCMDGGSVIWDNLEIYE
ncbi:MAG: hypothetical protein PUB07_03675 [Clostridia bacterium]|nr:hypothetical protein [Clostridia bacterium]